MSRRVQSAPAFFGGILCVGAALYGCTAEDTTFVPNSGTTGGATTAAGSTTYGQGGYTPTSSVVYARGGTTPTTGTLAGTTPTVGGATTAGTGTTAVTHTGGTTGAGTTGVTATGGATVAATTAANPNTGTAVTFAAGKAVGAMTGYGFVAMGSADAVTSPTCGTALTAITAAAPCAAGPNWSIATALCISGSIPALPAAPVTADYASNWGVSVGVNAADPAGGVLNQAFTSVAITVTGAPLTGLRAMVHKKGEADSVSYCAPMTAGTAIALTSFVTDCFNTTPIGTKITPADVKNIDKISVQVSSGPAAITVTELCITGITFS